MRREFRDLFEARVGEFERALEGFATLLAIDVNSYDEVVRDGLRNGQIQKFEYCAELMWKAARAFLLSEKSIKVSAPRDAVKEFYRESPLSDSDYEAMHIILDDRNLLSHLYRQELFEEVHGRLTGHLTVMTRVLEILRT